MQADAEGLMLDIRKPGLFNRMAKEGGTTVASHPSEMTGMTTAMEITKINFTAVEDIKRGVGDAEQIGIDVERLEPPYGHVFFLFQAENAKVLAGGVIGKVAARIPTPRALPTWSALRSGRAGTS